MWLSICCILFCSCHGQLKNKDSLLIYADSKAVWLTNDGDDTVLEISGAALTPDSLTRFTNHGPLVIEGNPVTTIHASKKLITNFRFILPDIKAGFNGSLVVNDRTFMLPDTLFYETHHFEIEA